MSNVYETKHGVTFDAFHSFRDFGLYPKSKMVIDPPKVREAYVEVAGADGDLDLTEALAGRANFDCRNAKFEFTVMNRESWDYIYSRLMNTIHGRRMMVILDDDPYWYYSGRVQVDSFSTNKNTATITVTGFLNPYKKARFASSTYWFWDSFNFETDVARDYKDLVVDGTLDVTVVGSVMPQIPSIVPSSNMSMKYDGVTYPLTANIGNIIPYMVVTNRQYAVLKFTGNGTVRINFDIGSL